MTIGEFASRASVNIQTIRFYERRGILPKPVRSRSGYRCYAESDLETLVFIRRSQDLGFTLQEICQLLPLHNSIATAPRANRRYPREIKQMATVARRRLDQVEEKLRALKSMRHQLQTFITQLETVAPLKCLAPASSRQKIICPGA